MLALISPVGIVPVLTQSSTDLFVNKSGVVILLKMIPLLLVLDSVFYYVNIPKYSTVHHFHVR